MSESRYAHIFARLKTLESRMLNGNQLIALVEAKENSQISRILSDSNYEQEADKFDPGSFFVENSIEFKRFMKKNLENEAFLDIYFSKEDFSNIKLWLKSGKLDFRSWHKVSPELITLFVEKKFNHFPHPFDVIIPEAIKHKENNMFEAEVYLDSKMFEYFMEFKNPFWNKYVKNLIDITNFRLIYRCHHFDMTKDFFSHITIPGGNVDSFKLNKAYSDSQDNVAKHFMSSDYFKHFIKMNEIYSKDKDFAQIEKEMDNMLIQIIKECKYSTLSVEPVIAYVLGAEFELKNLKMILEGKSNNVPEGVIKERLRETYV